MRDWCQACASSSMNPCWCSEFSTQTVNEYPATLKKANRKSITLGKEQWCELVARIQSLLTALIDCLAVLLEYVDHFLPQSTAYLIFRKTGHKRWMSTCPSKPTLATPLARKHSLTNHLRQKEIYSKKSTWEAKFYKKGDLCGWIYF